MTSPKTHAERMAELRTLHNREPAMAAGEALAYADELAARVAELSRYAEEQASANAETTEKHRVVCEIVKVVDGSNGTLRGQLEAERAKVAELTTLLKRYECRLFELGETPGETT